MSSLEIFGIVNGIIGVLSFVFAIWVWLKEEAKVKEFLETIKAIHDISGAALWEASTYLVEDVETKLRQAEKTLGFISSIRKLTGRFITNERVVQDSELGLLIEKGVIWSNPTMWNIETSKDVVEVWLITPDLEPDSSDISTGKVVGKNIAGGKKYVYFFPNDLLHSETKTTRLYNNLGLSNKNKKDVQKVTLVPLNREQYINLFARANLVLYFRDNERNLMPRCFEEIVFTKISERGVFWQEYPESKAEEIFYNLKNELHK